MRPQAMGAWVARQGWIQNSASNLPLLRRWLSPMLLGGLAPEIPPLAIEPLDGGALTAIAPVVLHRAATPTIAAGYICAIVPLWHGGTMSWLVKPFVPVGQMALTNYLMQNAATLTIFVVFGLAGRAGIATLLPIVLAFFGAQIVYSHFRMMAFAFGPAGWLWRALTYGERPQLRRMREVAA